MIENLGTGALEAQTTSILDEGINDIGESFEKMMNGMERLGEEDRQVNFSDVFDIQRAAFEYGFLQEAWTKIISKGTTAVNEVMKAQ